MILKVIIVLHSIVHGNAQTNMMNIKSHVVVLRFKATNQKNGLTRIDGLVILKGSRQPTNNMEVLLVMVVPLYVETFQLK